MKFSTKGRYALRVIIDLAEHNTGKYIPLTDIAKRQEISEKYLESIVSVLSKNGFVDAMRGKGGGYRLTREPKDYLIGEILRVTEKDLAPVSCLAEGAEKCEKRSACKTVNFWEGLYSVINEYMDSKTLADLL